jgi:phosphatidylglycerol:prolipoprotein diacylglycerol transferase
MTLFDVIIWSPDPAIFTIPLSGIGLSDRPIVWYGLLFALGFIISQQVMIYIYRKEGRPVTDVDTLTTFMVVATIIGARLGHVLFYNPTYYLSNPIEIIKVWEGGLASHGGGIAIFIAIWLYVNYDIRVKWWLILPVQFSAKKKTRTGQTYFWTLDRLAIVVALTGALIRTGNFMNSEMEGTPTGSNLGVVYARGTEDVLMYDEDRVASVEFTEVEDGKDYPPGLIPLKATIIYQRGVAVDDREEQFIRARIGNTLKSYSEVVQHIDFGPKEETLLYEVYQKGGRYYVDIYGVGTARHTSQLYEAIACVIIMVLLFYLWREKRESLPEGFIFGLFMILLFTQRFVDEYFKMDQEAFEADMTLNMGQWLSIPMVLFGAIVMIWSIRNKKSAN